MQDRPWRWPDAQLFPAPPPSLAMKTFSVLYSERYSEARMELITRGSRSMSRARGM